jgi:hypothetical protein
LPCDWFQCICFCFHHLCSSSLKMLPSTRDLWEKKISQRSCSMAKTPRAARIHTVECHKRLTVDSECEPKLFFVQYKIIHDDDLHLLLRMMVWWYHCKTVSFVSFQFPGFLGSCREARVGL